MQVQAYQFVPEMTRRIAEQFHPVQIILFGSLARGEGGPDSDADFLVVLREVVDKRHACVEIRRALRDLPACKDVFVTTPEEIEQRGHLAWDILHDALREGIVVYEGA